MKKLKMYSIRLLGLITVLLWSSNVTFNSFNTKSEELLVKIDKINHKKYKGQTEKFISQTSNKDNLFKDSSEDDTPVDYLDFGQPALICNFFTSSVYVIKRPAVYAPIFYKISLWIQHQQIII